MLAFTILMAVLYTLLSVGYALSLALDVFSGTNKTTCFDLATLIAFILAASAYLSLIPTE